MGDAFYRAVRFLGSPAFGISSTPVVAGLENIPATGPCLLAANHTSPYDIALLIRHVPRLVDFVSITEVFRNPLVAWFYGSMNAFPLERSRPDAPTVRIILSRLGQGRVVGMFPEGGFRRGAASAVHGSPIRPGIGRLAVLTNVPVVPVVIVNSATYARPKAWLPLRRTRYGLMFGRPIPPGPDPAEIEAGLVRAMAGLYAELRARLPEGSREV